MKPSHLSIDTMQVNAKQSASQHGVFRHAVRVIVFCALCTGFVKAMFPGEEVIPAPVFPAAANPVRPAAQPGAAGDDHLLSLCIAPKAAL